MRLLPVQLLSCVALVVICMTSSAFGASIDNSLYVRVLDKFLKNGLVDYAALKEDRADLDLYLDNMGRVDPASLSRDDRLAFYINLYNASTLKLIIDNYPVDSIKDIGSIFSSPWKKKVVVMNGELVTLDTIEHDIIRPEFKEPRIHFAVNCSAMSCPPLLEVPYEGAMLDDQLEHVAISHMNNVKHNYLDGTTFHVSKIFSWFSEDFPDDLVGWLLQFTQGELRARLEQLRRGGQKIKVKYITYDWSLNEQAR